MSDGCTDAARSSEIAELSNCVLGAELNFLARPTRQNLEYIFECCGDLEEMRTGYFGENPKSRAHTISSYYEKKFSGNEDFKVNLDDVVNLLNRISKECRVEILANLIALSTDDFGPLNKFVYTLFPFGDFFGGAQKAVGISTDEFLKIFGRYDKVYLESKEFIEDHFTITHKNLLQNELNEEKLERILKESMLFEKFPKSIFSPSKL